MKLTNVLAFALSVLCLAAPAAAQDAAGWRTIAPENLLVIDTAKGRILVEMDPRVAPQHVQRIRTLADSGFYDGLKFHRVVPGFMAQTGDPEGTGRGGSDLPDVPAELQFRRGRDSGFVPVDNSGPGLRGVMGSLPIITQPDAQMFVTADMKVGAQALFCPGTLGMARSNDLNSANSQFFLMMEANTNLDGSYTVVGRILDGMAVVTALNAGTEANNGAVANPDIMTHVRTAAAMPAAERPVVRVMDPSNPAFAETVATARAAAGARFGVCDLMPPVQVTGG